VADEPIVVALTSLPGTLDPLDDLEPWAWRIADDLVFEGLVRRDPTRAPWVEMALADRCETDDPSAPRTVTCHLRPDVEFHDGAQVSPDDVVYSLEYWLDPRRSWAQERRGLTSMKRVEIVDGPGGGKQGRDPGRWIRVSFSPAEPLALEQLAEIKIVPRQLHRGRGDGFGSGPVGTGPMKVVSMEGDRWALETVDGWQRGERRAPAIPGLVFRGIDDGARTMTLLRRGEVHVFAHVPPSYVPGELGRPGMAPRFRAFRLSPPRFDVLMFNTDSPTTDSVRMRHALEAAVPRVRIAREIYGTPGLELSAPVDLDDPREIELGPIAELPPGTDELTDVWTWPDAADDGLGSATAAAVLDQLGWSVERGLRRKSGNSLRVTLTWDGSTGRATQLANTIRSAWGAVGVRVPFATAAWGYLLTLFKRGEYDVAMARLAQHDDADLYPWFHSRGETNLSGISDAQLDAALTSFRAATSRAERVASERAVAQRLNELRVAPVIHAPMEVMLVSRRVEGLSFIDDLPRLDALELRPARTEAW